MNKEVDADALICEAISILQAKVLAGHSMLNGDSMWGTYYMPNTALERAIALLIEALDGV